jgi:hypothetical protein
MIKWILTSRFSIKKSLTGKFGGRIECSRRSWGPYRIFEKLLEEVERAEHLLHEPPVPVEEREREGERESVCACVRVCVCVCVCEREREREREAEKERGREGGERGLWFMVWGLGFRVWGLGFGI